jgi:uncharacterized protein (DUF427 family)
MLVHSEHRRNAMSKSPGHQQHSEHKIRVSPAGLRMAVMLGNEVLAESSDVLKLEEDGYPVRYYFPRADVRMDKLQPSATTSYCPYKGDAGYYNVAVNGRSLPDAVWTYAQPYDERRDLAGRLAFWDDKFCQLKVEARG